MVVLVLGESEVEQLITMEESIEAVEEAFRYKGLGEAQMPPKSYIYFPKFNGDFRTMPAYLNEIGASGVKVVNAHPDNPEEYGIPNVMAIIILLEPETGEPLSVMSGTKITGMRTGAAGAVSAKYLAREDSDSVGLIGAGAQAKTQLFGLNQVFDLSDVWVYSPIEEERAEFANTMSDALGIGINAVGEARKAVEGADIVVTVTPSRNPIVKDEWVKPGTHINAIGADAEGKQELEPEVLKRAKVVVDEWDQAFHSGEINVSVSEGSFSKEDLHADIGEVVTGEKPSRTSEGEVTVFDSTGLAVQDVATGWRVYEKAKEKDMGKELDLLSLFE